MVEVESEHIEVQVPKGHPQKCGPRAQGRAAGSKPSDVSVEWGWGSARAPFLPLLGRQNPFPSGNGANLPAPESQHEVLTRAKYARHHASCTQGLTRGWSKTQEHDSFLKCKENFQRM